MNPKSWNCNCGCSNTNTKTNKKNEESEMSNRECSMILRALIGFDDTLSPTTKEEMVAATIDSVLGKEE